jgi:2-keto-4-pentenoate hydratase/2-oxohepta-3-ene-1,7-dioic acid hydratase in catechol pathway
VRLVSYAGNGEERAGLLVDNVVYDVGQSAAFLGTPLPVGLPPRVLPLLESGAAEALGGLDAGIRAARAAGDDLPLACWAGLSGVRLLAPIPRPPKLLCLGLNYRDHALEQNAALPEVPLIFAKATSAVIASGDPIVIPRGSEKVDYEGEMAFVVGKRLKRTPVEDASAGIFGYTILNDVTERQIQKERVWFRAKGIDTFAPMGPSIVTADEVGNPLDLELATRVNGRVMQSGSTRNLIFTPAEIIAFLTRYVTLEPGDVISTGTPSGVGVFRKPQVFLKQGDVVEITVGNIGTLTNPVAAEA